MKLGKKNISRDMEQPALQDIQRMLACFEDDILPNIPSRDAILQRAKQRRLSKQRTTSALFAVLGTVIGIYWYNPAYQQQILVTEFGEQQDIRLFDGSQVKLNSNSQINVKQRLRSRELNLIQGEAVFTVAHGQNSVSRLFERPFTVTAGQMLIRDIGTVFNVHKLSEHSTTVTVLEGEVEVSLLHSDQSAVRLTQGQSISNYHNNLKLLEKVDLYVTQAWQSGKIIFEQKPLISALNDFQRYSHFNVVIENEQLKKIPINGQFQANNYQQFMQILPKVAPVKVRQLTDSEWRIENK